MIFSGYNMTSILSHTSDAYVSSVPERRTYDTRKRQPMAISDDQDPDPNMLLFDIDEPWHTTYDLVESRTGSAVREPGTVRNVKILTTTSMVKLDHGLRNHMN